MSLRAALRAGALVALALSFLISCSDNPVSTEVETSFWEAWSNPSEPVTPSYYLNSIWGNGEGDVYAVGWRDMVLHYDGQEWESLRSLGSTSANLNGIWGDAVGNLYVVGNEGRILHYDGFDWTSMDSGTSADLSAVWGLSARDVFAVGADGVVLHFDGDTWNSIDSGTDVTLHGVVGNGIVVFAVGDEGTILRLTHNGAFQVAEITTNDLLSIGGCLQSGLCAVGDAGTILRYDGSNWKAERSGTLRDFVAVRGTADGQLIVAGGRTLLVSNGSEWDSLDLSEGDFQYDSQGFIGVWGSSLQDMFLLQKDSIVHFDGVTAHAMDLETFPTPVPQASYQDLWGASGNCVYAVGKSEVFKYDGSDWNSVGGGSCDAVWGASENQVYTVLTVYVSEGPGGGGDWGESNLSVSAIARIYQFDGALWTEEQSFGDMTFADIWGSSGSPLFIAGAAAEFYQTTRPIVAMVQVNHPRIFRFADGEWSVSYSSDVDGRVNCLWGSSESDVYAGGSDGLILHFDGTSWTSMESGVSSSISGIWGSSPSDVFAVGGSGMILHYDGQSWDVMESGVVEWLNDIWGSAADDVYAVGANGIILHYDGSSWDFEPSPTQNQLYAIWGSGPDDIFVVGQYGTVLHYGQ